MMRKAKWKRVVAAGAILMSLGMVFPAADIQAEEVDFGPGIVEIVDDDSISTCADQIRIVYHPAVNRVLHQTYFYISV